MTYKEAIKIYLDAKSLPRRQIKLIMGWNPKLTLKENYQNLKFCSLQHASIFKQKYGLKTKYTRGKKQTINLTHKAEKILRDNGFTFAEIGKIFGKTKQAIAQRN